MTTSIDSTAISTTENHVMHENEPVALLIAIEDYRAYDASGKSDLRAGRNDVIAYWKVCRRLGYEPKNIWVLTSPKLSPSWIYEAELDMREDLDRSLDDFDKRAEEWCAAHAVQLGEATRGNIEAHAARLSAGIMEVRETESEYVLAGSRAFLAYSGHGMRIDDELALCPSDIEKDHGKAIKLSELKSWILGDNAKDGKTLGRNLTVVLDCCFAAARQDETNVYQRVTSLGEVGTAGGKRPAIDLGSRVFCAAGPGEQSYQALLGGYWYSAFTWAFTVALEQWQIHERDAAATISHNELLFRTRMLLEALSFKQHPQLLGKVGLSNEPVFGHYDKRGRGTTSVTPNAERSEGQLVPDYKYTIEFETSAGLFGAIVIVVTGTGDTALENWYLQKSNIGQVKNAKALRVKTEKSSTTPSTDYYTLKTVNAKGEGSWSKSRCTIAGSGTDHYFLIEGTGNRYCLRLNVDSQSNTVNGAVWYASSNPGSNIILGEVGSTMKWARVDAPSTIDGTYYWLKSW
jgi:hypothetical protein